MTRAASVIIEILGIALVTLPVVALPTDFSSLPVAIFGLIAAALLYIWYFDRNYIQGRGNLIGSETDRIDS
jgi:uncharacterized membrane protein